MSTNWYSPDGKSKDIDNEDPRSSPGVTNDVVLQFGKVAQDRFTMDVQYPLSIYQAFAICVACMDGKIADRRGYEYIKRLTGKESLYISIVYIYRTENIDF